MLINGLPVLFIVHFYNCILFSNGKTNVFSKKKWNHLNRSTYCLLETAKQTKSHLYVLFKHWQMPVSQTPIVRQKVWCAVMGNMSSAKSSTGPGQAQEKGSVYANTIKVEITFALHQKRSYYLNKFNTCILKWYRQFCFIHSYSSKPKRRASTPRSDFCCN